MASTGWLWETIKRTVDEERAGGLIYQRKNWRVIRSRRSSDAYASQEGETATSLTANNGGVDEVVDAPTINGMTFATIDFDSQMVLDVDDTSNYGYYDGWYLKTGVHNGAPYWYKEEGAADMAIYYDGANVWKWDLYGIEETNHMYASGAIDADITTLSWTHALGYIVPGTAWSESIFKIADAGDAWVESGLFRGGYPVYVLKNVPDDYHWVTRQPVAWYSTESTVSGERWVIANVLNTEIADDSFEDVATSTNFPEGYAWGTSEEADIEATEFAGFDEWYGNTEVTCELGDVTVPLTCTDEEQSYPNPYSQWYKQTQEWTYIEPFALV